MAVVVCRRMSWRVELGTGRVVLWVVASGCTAVVVVLLSGVVVEDGTVAVVVVEVVVCRGVDGPEVVWRRAVVVFFGVSVAVVWGGAAVFVAEGVAEVAICRGCVDAPEVVKRTVAEDKVAAAV